MLGTAAPGSGTHHEAPPDSKIDVFAQAQLRATTRAAFELEERFLLETKPAYRAEERAQPGAGFAMMSRDLQVLRRQRERAEAIQHSQALRAWTLGLAHEDVGEYIDAETHQSQGTKILDDKDKTKLRAALRTGRGVLQVKFLGFGPQHGVTIESTTLRGLPMSIRDQLLGRTYAEANLPIIADGRIISEGGDPGFTIGVAAGEAHAEVHDNRPITKQYLSYEATGDRAAARRWLAARVRPLVGEPDEATVHAGAHQLLIEAIGHQRIDTLAG